MYICIYDYFDSINRSSHDIRKRYIYIYITYIYMYICIFNHMLIEIDTLVHNHEFRM
jgi:hypothetical protein